MNEKYRRTAAWELNQARSRAGLPPLLPDRLRAMSLSQLVSAVIDAQRMARKCGEAVHRPHPTPTRPTEKGARHGPG